MANMEKFREAILFDYQMERKYLKKMLKSSEITDQQREHALKRIREDDYWIRKIKKEIAEQKLSQKEE